VPAQPTCIWVVNAYLLPLGALLLLGGAAGDISGLNPGFILLMCRTRWMICTSLREIPPMSITKNGRDQLFICISCDQSRDI
jgi:hypothetical protein